jgi:hypothetical protein
MSPVLTPDQIDRLEQEIARVFEIKDFDKVLARYPGRGDPSTFLPANPNNSMRDITSRCLREVEHEGTLMPFLSRVVEHKWDKEPFRRAIFAQARSLARPAGDTAPDTVTIIAALKGLAAIPINPTSGTCDIKKVCQFRQANENSIAEIIRSLDQFEAIKILHDSLHVLQVKGAEWLDQGETDGEVSLPLPVLLAVVDGVRSAAVAVKPRVPPTLIEICQRCKDTALDATARLTSAGLDNHDFALAQLRVLLVSEPPELDQAMFVLSRDLPIKQLRGLLESAADCAVPVSVQAKTAVEALDRLSETLRAHILEHALWQATDIHVRAASQFLAHPSPRFLGDFVPEWSAIRDNLRTLVDPSAGGAPGIESVVNAALVLYDGALPRPGLAIPSGPSSEQRLAELAAAFNDFRQEARLHFLAVDQALKSLFSSLLPLRASLEALTNHLPIVCVCPP